MILLFSIFLVFPFRECLCKSNKTFDVIIEYEESPVMNKTRHLYPLRYMESDGYSPNKYDLIKYLDSLKIAMDNNYEKMNISTFEEIINYFFISAILTRTLEDNGHRLQSDQKNTMLTIIDQCEFIVSSFHNQQIAVLSSSTDVLDSEIDRYRLSLLLGYRERKIFSSSLGGFERDKIFGYIYIRQKLPNHEYMLQLDGLDVPVAKYVEKTVNYKFSDPTTDMLDHCLTRVLINVEPSIDKRTMGRCKQDRKCKNMIFKPTVKIGVGQRYIKEDSTTSSIGIVSKPQIKNYNSHTYQVVRSADQFCIGDRNFIEIAINMGPTEKVVVTILINAVMYRFLRRCYWSFPAKDKKNIDYMCASMYREAVYIARRGYFSREIFLENVALCAMLGYEEFYRKDWFRKALSWVNKVGCVKEARNFQINRTDLTMRFAASDKVKAKMRKSLKKQLKEWCHRQPTSAFSLYLASGIRHALHFKQRRQGGRAEL